MGAKIFNYAIALIIACLPIIVVNEYGMFIEPVMLDFLVKSSYFALAFWVIVPAVMGLVKKHIPSASDGTFKGKEAVIVFASAFAIWALIYFTNV